MRLNKYLTEGRSVPLSDDEGNKLLRGNNYYGSTFGTPIYRGVPNVNSKFLYIEPNKFERVSANTENFYTLLIDNSERWKKYPKRSKSIICSTSIATAHNYGKIYRVIPKVGSLIGLCPCNDIWKSFEFFLPIINTFINVLAHQKNITKIGEIETYYDLVVLFNDYDYWRDEAYNDIRSNLEEDEEIDEHQFLLELLEDQLLMNIYNPDLKHLIKLFVEYYIKDKDSIDFLENILDPKDNDFALVKAGNHTIPTNREVWTEGPCLLVEEL